MSNNRSIASLFLDLALAQFWSRKAEGMMTGRTYGMSVCFIQSLDQGLPSAPGARPGFMCEKTRDRKIKRKYSVQ